MASQHSEPLKHRNVVSSFIFKYTDGKPSVALFRRSDKVNTYQHRLAPISGSINDTDASPLAAAWREIREETTLTPASLVLLRQGKSYSFSDESIGRSWTIYPFAFKLKTAEAERAIKIDWEHDDWGWHDPLAVEDSDAFGGVPRLAESLRRVWFEKDLGDDPGKVLAEGLEHLKNDHQSGARQLASIALEILRDVVVKLETGESAVEWWAKLRFAAWHIWKNGRESMGAAIMVVLLAALGDIEDIVKEHHQSTNSEELTKCKEAALGVLAYEIERRYAESSMRITHCLADYLEATYYADKRASHKPLAILTMSESSTIAHGVRYLATNTGFDLDVRVLESRPLFEGVSLVGSMVEKCIICLSRDSVRNKSDDGRSPKIKINIYSDASAALAARGIDVLIIGADRIASNGAVSNKTGSLPAILSARHTASKDGRQIKVIVLAESEKVAPPGSPDDHVVEENDPEQLTRAWAAEYNSDRVRSSGQIFAEMEKESSGSGDGAAVEFAAHNVFFEWVSPELIDLYMTEFGAWTVDDIARHSERLAANEQRLFGDL